MFFSSCLLPNKKPPVTAILQGREGYSRGSTLFGCFTQPNLIVLNAHTRLSLSVVAPEAVSSETCPKGLTANDPSLFKALVRTFSI